MNTSSIMDHTKTYKIQPINNYDNARFGICNTNYMLLYKFKLICKFNRIDDLNKNKFDIIKNTRYFTIEDRFTQYPISLFENIAIASLFKKKIIKIINNKIIILLIYFSDDPIITKSLTFNFTNIFKYCNNIYLKYKAIKSIELQKNITLNNKKTKYYYNCFGFYDDDIDIYISNKYKFVYHIDMDNNITSGIILYFKDNIKYTSIKSIKLINLDNNQIIKLNKKHILVSKYIGGTIILICPFLTIKRIKKLIKNPKKTYKKKEKIYFDEYFDYEIKLNLYKNKKIINVQFFNARSYFI